MVAAVVAVVRRTSRRVTLVSGITGLYYGVGVRTRLKYKGHGMFVRRILLAAGGFLLWSAETPSVEERLARHRNLGKAFYENPTTQVEAVAEFRRALELA